MTSTVLEKNVRNRQMVQKRRDVLRERGFRPVQIWIPDIRKDSVLKEITRQLQVISNDPHEREYGVFLEAAAMSIDGWE